MGSAGNSKFYLLEHSAIVTLPVASFHKINVCLETKI